MLAMRRIDIYERIRQMQFLYGSKIILSEVYLIAPYPMDIWKTRTFVSAAIVPHALDVGTEKFLKKMDSLQSQSTKQFVIDVSLAGFVSTETT